MSQEEKVPAKHPSKPGLLRKTWFGAAAACLALILLFGGRPNSAAGQSGEEVHSISLPYVNSAGMWLEPGAQGHEFRFSGSKGDSVFVVVLSYDFRPLLGVAPTDRINEIVFHPEPGSPKPPPPIFGMALPGNGQHSILAMPIERGRGGWYSLFVDTVRPPENLMTLPQIGDTIEGRWVVILTPLGERWDLDIQTAIVGDSGNRLLWFRRILLREGRLENIEMELDCRRQMLRFLSFPAGDGRQLPAVGAPLERVVPGSFLESVLRGGCSVVAP